ncbi:ribose-5-phosphate isomerase [Auriscalpium vulgare]|uniref:Ribose-5-phosphate isomerase n=1 Tax=Auriscalpium vulgare TaxID=40419 RepID=A0ACB8S5S9_9AGAM|nr:ribose-5-phosphate isomerase [Auriscalpium vulgare]
MATTIPLTAIEGAKRLAAFTAVDRHILSQHKVIGIGSGSTVPYVVDRIVSQGLSVNKDRVFLATGFQSQQLIVNAGLRLGDIDQFPVLDVTIDGADEVDPDLNCIKGGGACHLREKVLAEGAKTFIVVADYRKNSQVLGANYAPGVPIEVAPFAATSLLRSIKTLKTPPLNANLRMGTGKAGPVVTDNGNFVVDAVFGPEAMSDPVRVLHAVKLLTGVVEVGLFCNVAKAAYFGNQDGSVTVKLADGQVSQIEASSDA